ncbi:hypothetical protein BLL42_21265 [Pseudomonas frederiksbergensis]|uniref:Lipoprotein n=1 Tax=Pseudomonas frederiksbergensis TaxID=104087 RepID=A0A1J0EQB6_9PSED|nr:hypothetical protein [Pseudomonas frederiksbergensis]APC18131.1 hypothetical protein BLL42_21265 [Pseudomonas frederiksbergensis]
MNQAFTVLSMIAGALSAICWVCSAASKVKTENATTRAAGSTFDDAQISSDGHDVIATLKLQGKWNSAAAVLAAVTMGFQVAASFYPCGC